MINFKNESLEILLRKYSYIFWDYDDTISPTVLKKGKAYAKIFDEYPNELKEFIVKHHKKFPGVSRKVKLPLYFKESLKYKKSINNKKLKDLENLFSLECIQILSNTPFFKNIEEFLKKNNKKNFIITNMPQEEIDVVLKLKCANNYFYQVKGNSIDKSEVLKKILKSLGSNKKSVFIGDSEGDYIAAKKSKIDFILKKSDLNKNLQIIPKMKI